MYVDMCIDMCEEMLYASFVGAKIVREPWLKASTRSTAFSTDT